MMKERTNDRHARKGGWLSAHGVCRVAGLPFDSLESLAGPMSTAFAGEMIVAQEKAGDLRDTLIDRLYDLIGTTKGRRTRIRLIELRRSIHRLDLPATVALENLTQQLSPTIVGDIEALRSALQVASELSNRFENAYREELASTRQSFQSLLKDADFMNGLLLSSRSLSLALPKYTSLDGVKFTGRQEKLERGLLRYYTRTSAKATPFGTLCSVIPAVLEDSEDIGIRFNGDPKHKRSFVRLNKNLYGILVAHLRNRKEIRVELPIELNPTIQKNGNRLAFLAGIHGVEIFQRLQSRPILDLIASTFDDHSALRLRELITAIVDHPQVDAGRKEVERFIERLLDIGMLRFRIGIREQEANWDFPLREFLKDINDVDADVISALLKQLRSAMNRYPGATTEQRSALLREMNASLQAAFEQMAITARIKNDLVIYEDASADAALSIPARTVGDQLASDLLHFAQAAGLVAWPRSEQAAMRHFFDHFYPGSSRVPLLQFYEDYFREHFKEHLEKENVLRRAPRDSMDYDVQNPFGINLVTTIQQAQKALSDVIRSRWAENPEADEIALARADLDRSFGSVAPLPDESRSTTFFGALIPASPQWPSGALVVPNGIHYLGFGKYFSRFLYFLPDTVYETIRQDNDALARNRLAEICGDAQFNANLHPPLLPWEISYPTGESGDAKEQLRISDLHVSRHDSDPHQLCLLHEPSRERVLPVDLGFLNPRMRPALYQLLSRFTPSQSFGIALPRSFRLPTKDADPTTAAEDPTLPMDSNAAAAPGSLAPMVISRPRIVYEDTLILSRRTWFIPAPEFPTIRPDETPHEHFARVVRWRRQHGIPEQVYVRIRPFSFPPTPSREAEQATDNSQTSSLPSGTDSTANGGTDQIRGPRTVGSKDYLKPQYIDLGSPLLVKLLGKMAANLTKFEGIIEERLPASASLPQYEGERFVTEVVMQVNISGDPIAALDSTGPRDVHHAF